MRMNSCHYFFDEVNNDDLVFIFREQELFLTSDEDIPSWEYIHNDVNHKGLHYCFAEINHKRCLILHENSLKSESETLIKVSLKEAWRNVLTDDIKMLAVRAGHLHHWRETHQYCGCCCQKLEEKLDEVARICQACDHIVYPRISPCVIVLITDGDRVLLGRSPHFMPGVYSTLAGFIEPGESAEEALHREIKEEVGITVKNVLYQGSQPWPFPDSLMFGFYAEYEGGEITVDGVEIEDAQWFSIDNLPDLPQSQSISRQLIDNYIKKI